MSQKEEIFLFTDGACSGNPGPGGWAVLMRFKNVEKMLSGGEALTTNNRMEMQAVISGLEALKRSCKVLVTTDSKYVQDGVMKWMHAWAKNNWVKKDKKEIKNLDLWKQLYRLNAMHEVDWKWVKGHSGHTENERVDDEARAQSMRYLSLKK